MTIYEQTGWVRPAPKAICQDIAILEKITVFAYDLKHHGFLDYVMARTGIKLASAACGLERMLALDAMSEGEYLKQPECCEALKPLGATKGYRYTPGEIVSNMAIRNLRKAQIQDCWEVFIDVYIP